MQVASKASYLTRKALSKRLSLIETIRMWYIEFRIRNAVKRAEDFIMVYNISNVVQQRLEMKGYTVSRSASFYPDVLVRW